MLLPACYRGGCAPPVPDGGDGVGPDRNAQVIEDDPFGESVQKIAYLDQGWSPEDSQRFYFTSQGSQIVPYTWFLQLEQPDSTDLFREDRNMLRFRYLPQRPDEMNPDGLPVGFVRDEGIGRDWLSVNCAACHVTQIDYEGVGYRIDGGPALADVTGFLRSLTEALKQTRDDDAKFGRFAERVLGSKDTPKARDVLKEQMEIVIARATGTTSATSRPTSRPGTGGLMPWGRS